jgi:hypothetical protein
MKRLVTVQVELALSAVTALAVLCALAPAAASASAAASPAASAIAHAFASMPASAARTGPDQVPQSPNYAGWLAGTFGPRHTRQTGTLSADTTFTVPAVTGCTSTDDFVVIGVGLPTGTTSVTAIGVAVGCMNGAPFYGGEIDINGTITPATPTVSPGDVIVLKLKVTSAETTGKFTDQTTGASQPIKGTGSSPTGSCVGIDGSENGGTGGDPPVPDFGKVVFTNSEINGATIPGSGAVRVNMATPAGVLQIATGAVTKSGKGFTSTFKNTGSSGPTWSVSPGGSVTASGSAQVKDTTTGTIAKCTSLELDATLASGSGLPGAGIGSITSGSFTGCTIATISVSVASNGFPWQLNATSYNSSTGVTTGTITGIDLVATAPGCSATLDGTAAGADNGKIKVTYTNSTGVLKLLSTGGNLHDYAVSGCFGLVNNNDPEDASGTTKVTPKQTITSP